MSLFVRLLDEIDDVIHPVSAVLLKARRLAEELPGRKFKAWVQLEMNGYRGTEAKVPDYRSIGVTCTGNFIGAWRVTDFPLPFDQFSREIQDLLSRHEFLDGVGALEGFSQTKRENLASPLPPALIRYFQMGRIPGTPANCVLIEAYKQIPVLAIRGILYAVRSRLLEFVLQLGRDCPEMKSDDAAIARVPEARVETLVQKVIIEGDNAAVNVFMAKQQVHASGVDVDGSFVVADEVGDSFKGDQSR